MSRWVYIAPAIAIHYVFRRVFSNQYLYMLLALGGTIAHELCHLIVGFCLNAKPTSFSIIPRRVNNENWTLGNVSFKNIRWYNGAFVGMAPLLLLLPFYLCLPASYSFQDVMYINLKDVAYWLLLAYIFPSAIPSKMDLKISLFSSLPIAVVFCFYFALKYL